MNLELKHRARINIGDVVNVEKEDFFKRWKKNRDGLYVESLNDVRTHDASCDTMKKHTAQQTSCIDI